MAEKSSSTSSSRPSHPNNLDNTTTFNMLKQAKPKNARAKRAIEKQGPKIIENPKTTLILRGEKTSNIVQLALADLCQLKEPFVHKFNLRKKNPIHPFEDVTSLEFFSEKNDCALMLFGISSKKRPHCLTMVRTFDHKILDMVELYIDPDTFRTLSQFKNKKVAAGLKPMVAFSGTVFESPEPNAYTAAKSLLLDMFRGQDASSVDVEGLQCLIHISAGEEVDGQPGPQIHFRVYRIITKKSGQKLPRVEVEEIGPRLDFRVGRTQEPEEAMLKEAMRRPKQLEPKTKKNISMDDIGDKIGRIHVGKQDLSNLQTRKMKGLKRSRDEAVGDDMQVDEAVDGAVKRAK